MTYNMFLGKKTIDEYEIDLYGFWNEVKNGELAPDELCFTRATFSDGKDLNDSQLARLSNKYPEVIYDLIKDILPEDSPHHATYAPLVDRVIQKII